MRPKGVPPWVWLHPTRAFARAGEIEMSAQDHLTSRPSSDGRTIYVRLVSPEDREKLGRMLSRLSLRTIHERFHVPYPRVPGWALVGMVEVDHPSNESSWPSK